VKKKQFSVVLILCILLSTNSFAAPTSYSSDAEVGESKSCASLLPQLVSKGCQLVLTLALVAPAVVQGQSSNSSSTGSLVPTGVSGLSGSFNSSTGGAVIPGNDQCGPNVTFCKSIHFFENQYQLSQEQSCEILDDNLDQVMADIDFYNKQISSIRNNTQSMSPDQLGSVTNNKEYTTALAECEMIPGSFTVPKNAGESRWSGYGKLGVSLAALAAVLAQFL
jgi:hypothetical protein